jgi:hypothetical protein
MHENLEDMAERAEMDRNILATIVVREIERHSSGFPTALPFEALFQLVQGLEPDAEVHCG